MEELRETKNRMDNAETGIMEAKEHLQHIEDATLVNSWSFKNCSRTSWWIRRDGQVRENIRICGVKGAAEDNTRSMIDFT